MRIALLSDTHDNSAAITQAAEKVKELEITATLHCGDMVAPYILQQFKAEWPGTLYFVWGNNDGERGGLMKTAMESEGKLVCLETQRDLELDGKRIFMTHFSPLSELVAKAGEYDFCFGGHDHTQRRVAYGRSIFVNPGNLTVKESQPFYKSNDHCFCVVDLLTSEVIRIDL